MYRAALVSCISCALALLPAVLHAQTSLGSQGAPPKLDPAHGQEASVLWPDDDHTMQGFCDSKPSGTLEITLGGNSYVATSFPHTVISYRNFPRLWLDRAKNGALTVSSTFSDHPNSTIIDLDRNKFHVDTELVDKVIRPSRSRLIVIGSNQKTILNVWYENSSTVVLSGKMYFGNELIEFSPTQTTFNSNSLDENCVINSSVDLAFSASP